MKRIPPWLTLLLLAPLLGEIVSGHQPPVQLCNPLSVALLMLPYGLGALVCRELVRRWRKGGLSLMLMAVAYGIFEEAIVVRSFFDPNWSELENLKQYYALGVNWNWSETMVHFHVLISVAAAVILAEMIHADRRTEPWLGDRGLIACILGLTLWVPAGWLMTRFVPPASGYILSWIAIAGLVLAARRLPAGFPRRVKKSPPHPLFFWLLGFVNMTVFFVSVFMLPDFWAPPLWLAAGGLVVLDALTLGLLLRWSGNGGAWDDRHRLAWVAGGLGFFVLFNFFSDVEEGFAGRSCVSAFAIIALAVLAYRIRKRPRTAAQIPADNSSPQP
ncbi:MAG: hypothetical protein JW929_14500 [Anaerolineales bacterium]|nr:hypothetical protein [Anaerolineales bacterium]